MISDHEQKIRELKEQIRKEEEQIKKLSTMSPEIRVAEFLHEKLCHSNHTDGCGWFYEKWEDVERGYAKKRYLQKAKALLQLYDENTIEHFVKILKDGRF